MSNTFLTPKEVAKILKISYENALNFIRYSGIPYIQIGRQYRVAEETLKAFLLQNNPVIVDTSGI